MLSKLTAKYHIDMEFYGTLLALALPIAFQNLVSSSLNMIDTIMIGQLGQVPIAAVGLANQLFFLFNLFLFGINSGTAIFTAQFWGKQDLVNIRRVQGISLMTCTFVAFIFTGIAFAFPATILNFFTRDQSVITLGTSYLRIVSFSYLATAISFTYASILRSTGEVVLPLKINIIAIGVNTLLNYLLIYGNSYFPKLGVDGAAIATVIARFIEVLSLIWIVYKEQLVPAATWKELSDYNLNFVKNFFKTTIPVILNESLWAAGMTMYTIVYARMGTGIIAAINIFSTVERMAMVLFFGMAQACAVMIGNKIGAGEGETAFLYGKRFAILGPAVGLLTGTALIFSTNWIISFYHVSSEVLNLTTKIILIFALTIPIRIFNLITIVGILRSGGDTRFSLFIDIGGMWLVAVPLAFLAGLVWKVPAHLVYLLVASEEFFKLFLGIIRLFSKRWINNLTHQIPEF